MYEEKLEKYFEDNKQELINDIFKLIEIPSVCSEPKEGKPFGDTSAEGLKAALSIAEKMGFKVKNLDNCIGFADMNDKDRQVDILTHVDVVPAYDDWKVTDPYVPVLKDDKIYGRGSADDKGPLVAVLYAMKAIKDLNIPITKNIRMVIGAAEEIGVRTELDRYYRDEKVAPMTISPDAEYPIINIEKGSLRGKVIAEYDAADVLPRIIQIKSGSTRSVIPGEAEAKIKGLSKEEILESAGKFEKETEVKIQILEKNGDEITIKAVGKATHAGAPQKGNNGLTGIISFLSKLPMAKCEGFKKICGLNKIFPHGDWLGKAIGIERNTEYSGFLHISFNIFNYTETGFRGSFDSKLPVSCNDENTKNILLNKFKEFSIDIKDCVLRPAHHVDMNSNLVKTLLKYYEQYTNTKGYGVTIDGETYVHNIENGVAFGFIMPGVDNNLHLADEFIEVDNLITSAKIYAQSLIEVCE